MWARLQVTIDNFTTAIFWLLCFCNKICGFLDLTSANMPHDHGMEHAGTDIEAAVCAIVENAAHVEVDNARSEIFFVSLKK